MKNITLEQLGFNNTILNTNLSVDRSEWARVITEHKERYVVQNEEGTFDAEIMGHLRFTAQDRSDFPIVGDWVKIMPYDQEKALIHEVLYRVNALQRQAVGKEGKVQYISSNIDYAFIVFSANRDFNLNRIERYILLCHDAEITPILILSKTDLVDQDTLESLQASITDRFPTLMHLTTQTNDEACIEVLKSTIEPFKTYCFLGSSGVGKSTLVNLLLENEKMLTQEIGDINNRGKHTTTHRELIILPEGGILIDNPGMREVGVVSRGEGFEDTYPLIIELSQNCKFTDCTHQHEKGCAVIEAVEEGEISEESYQNFLKLNREQEYFESTELDRRQKGKALSKMVKSVQKNKYGNRW